MKWFGLFMMAMTWLLFSGCGSEEGEGAVASAPQGWHFQGRDCLACHNTDLGENKQLLYGATLYKTPGEGDRNDLAQMCGGEFVVNFLDSAYTVQVSSADYETPGSKGYQGKGNLFVLQRELGSLQGDYYVQIADKKSGLTLAQSTALHSFNGADYSVESLMDINNRRACNACHNEGGMSSRIFVQINSDICQ